MATQCPKCFYHQDHIWTIEPDPKTGKKWAIERCPNCNQSFEIESYDTYKKNKQDERRNIRKNDAPKPIDPWSFGV